MIRYTPAAAPALALSMLPGRWMVNRLLRLPREVRRALVLMVQLLLALVSSYTAVNLRFDTEVPRSVLKLFLGTLPWLFLARGSTFLLFRLDEGIWRYAGLYDLRRIGVAVGTSTIVFFIFVRWGYHTDDYPRSIYLIDAMLLFIMMGVFRLTPRLFRELGREPGERRLLIVGAGDTGERILRDMHQHPNSIYEPIGFVDDDQSKVGDRLHGAPILGTIADLPAIVKREKPHEVLIALPNATPSRLREIVALLEPTKVPITTARTTAAHGAAPVSQIRSLSIEDLLSRPKVDLGLDRVQQLVAGRRVMVTGAGGSIGSELSVQIAALEPESLVLYERYENGLYAVAGKLHDSHRGHRIHEVIGDITDEARLEAVLSQYRPEIIFHAAAHKHVPLMELNPCEAVKNNVTGTRTLAETAARHGVERFILISTDKAVNPSSVMGATKRIAEIVVQKMSARSSTRFSSVRFGNVLGSNGSVLLRFQDQVKTGGPVTVTHPEITRYFMLIPEAVELVLHAAAVGRGGDTLILDMGEQIKVVDLARTVIRLSGRVPDEEIPIVFIGLRPGEKLYEELAWQNEQVEASPVDKVLRIVPDRRPMTDLGLEAAILELERCAVEGDVTAVQTMLGRLLPGFRPADTLQSV
jgi:FlaA1/EpsC-like NDP-sugar epimerase